MRLAVALALCLAACSVDPLPLPDSGPDTGSGRVCAPGAQVACACVGVGARGAQVCRDDGSGYEACECPDAGSPVDSGRVDTGTDTGAVDAGVDVQVPVDVVADIPRDEGADVADAGSCADGEALCEFAGALGCFDLQRSYDNCGACGRFCYRINGATSVECRAGACQVQTCVAGQADCDRAPNNGCEIHLRFNESHCGACGRACPARLYCCDGTCQAAACP